MDVEAAGVVAVDWSLALEALTLSATKVRPVAKKKASGSETRKFNTLVRMEDELIEKAKKLAAIRGISLGELFSPVLWPFVDRELKKEGRKLAGDDPSDS
jgi:hypothetical protein